MCGRYLLRDKPDGSLLSPWKQYHDELNVAFSPRYNIGPSQSAPVIVMNQGELVCRELTWGWKSSWSPNFLFNAKCEEIRAKNPAWINHAKHSPALIPADGFYEPKTPKRLPFPWYGFQFRDQRTFYFAGLLASVGGKSVFVLITKLPNEEISPIHHRMGVIWDAANIELGQAWMDTTRSWSERLDALETPINYADLDYHRVPDLAKTLSNTGPECFQCWEDAPEQGELF